MRKKTIVICLRKQKDLYFKIIKIFRNLKIRTRMVLLFMVLSIIPMLLVVCIFYQEYSASIQEKISTYSVQVMSQIARNIERDLVRLENTSIEIEFSDIVQQTLYSYKDMSDWEVENAQVEMRENFTKKFYSLHNVSDVLIYTKRKEKIIAYGDPGMKLNLKPGYINSLMYQLEEKNGGIVWDAVNADNEVYLVKYATSAELLKRSDGILLGRAIKSLKDGSIIGYLVIRSNEEYLSDVYRKIDMGQGSKLFVLSSTGVVISSADPSLRITSHYPDEELLSQIKRHAAKGDSVFNYSKDGDKYLVSFSAMEGADWFVVGVIPFSYLNSNVQDIYQETIVIAIVCFFLSLLLAYFFAAMIIAPLNRLRSAMNQAQQGDLSAHLRDDFQDEIGEVAQHFNKMLRQIKNLLESVKLGEQKKRQAELRALQAQINPHFLANTLNTVRFLAKTQNAPNIENITTALINIFQVMAGRGDSKITIKSEVEYLKSYLEIQEYRYLDKFQVIYNIDTEILMYRIPKLLLQPIVENALIHGIEPMEGQGLLVLKGYKEADNIKIVITDNGVGIPPEKLKNILCTQERKHAGLSGIGITNVDERIKMYFGEPYGLVIESVYGFYTMVEVTIPAIQ